MTEDRQRPNGSSKDRDLLLHPRVQKINAGLVWIMAVAVVTLVYTAGQKSTKLENIASDVTEIKEQLQETAPAVLAARLDGVETRLAGLESWLRSLSQRVASASTPTMRGFTPSSSSSSHDDPP